MTSNQSVNQSIYLCKRVFCSGVSISVDIYRLLYRLPKRSKVQPFGSVAAIHVDWRADTDANAVNFATATQGPIMLERLEGSTPTGRPRKWVTHKVRGSGDGVWTSLNTHSELNLHSVPHSGCVSGFLWDAGCYRERCRDNQCSCLLITVLASNLLQSNLLQ